jgi:hypothetical protein
MSATRRVDEAIKWLDKGIKLLDLIIKIRDRVGGIVLLLGAGVLIGRSQDLLTIMLAVFLGGLGSIMILRS